MVNLLKTLIKEHPTLLLTFCYLLITFIGALYSYFFYSEFGINIVKFADFSDFLLVSVLEPRSILMFLGVTILSILGNLFDAMIRKRFKKFGKLMNERFKSKYTDAIFSVGTLAVVTFLMVSNLAWKNAQSIKTGTFDRFEVRIADYQGDKDDNAIQSLALLGTTSRFGYFYDVNKTQTLVVPVENITYMVKKLIAPEAK
jgi:hypothetical protein